MLKFSKYCPASPIPEVMLEQQFRVRARLNLYVSISSGVIPKPYVSMRSSRLIGMVSTTFNEGKLHLLRKEKRKKRKEKKKYIHFNILLEAKIERNMRSR
jgi:hypothetical protein